MSGKLNHRSSLLRLKDSIKKNIKKEVDNAKPLTCYDETIEKKSFGRIKDIDELPYETRIGIAKWFKNNKIYEEVITKLLWINPQHINTMDIQEIDPIKKKYLSIDDIHDLGIEYEPPATDIKEDKTQTIQSRNLRYSGQNNTFLPTLSAKDKQKMREVQDYLEHMRRVYKKTGVFIDCPHNIKAEIMSIRRNYNIDTDSIWNIMKWFRRQLLRRHRTKRKFRNPHQTNLMNTKQRNEQILEENKV